MKSIQELREVRAEKSKALNDLVDTKRTWDAAADKPVYDALMNEYEDLTAQIKLQEVHNAKLANEAMDGMLKEGGERQLKDKKDPSGKLYAKWLRLGDNGLNAEEWQSIRNTMSVGTNSQGGFTVMTEVARTVLDALQQYGAMRSVSTILQTAMGNPLQFPASDGRAEVGEWIGENTTATSADPVFTQIALPVYKASSKIAAIPFELLQDSNVDIEAFVRQRLVTRLGRITNTGYTVGTGTAQPTGVNVAATTGFTAANATSQVTTITYASLVELIHSIDPAYRNNGCKFMMHDSSLKKVRQITDTQSRPIFVPGYTLGITGAALSAPDTIMGYGVQVNQDMPIMAASAKSITFGDFSFYYIRDVMALEMFRFSDSAYAKLGQVGFLAWMRTGGNLIDNGGSVKNFVNAAT